MYSKVPMMSITLVVYWTNFLKVMHPWVNDIKPSGASPLETLFKVMPLFVSRIKLVVDLYWNNSFKVMHPSCKVQSNTDFFKIKWLIPQKMGKINTWYYSAWWGARFAGFAMKNGHLEFFLWANEFSTETVQVGGRVSTPLFSPRLISTTSKVFQISPYPNGYVINMPEFDFWKKNCHFSITFLTYFILTPWSWGHLIYHLWINFILFLRPVKLLEFNFLTLKVHGNHVLHRWWPKHLFFSFQGQSNFGFWTPKNLWKFYQVFRTKKIPAFSELG